MRSSPRIPGRSTVVVLFGVAVCALLTATTLTVVILTADVPERAGPNLAAVPATLPSPVERTTVPTRTVGRQMCLIGSWTTVDEVFNIKFYTDEPEMRFTGSGRRYEFRPDGTGAERLDNVVLTTTFRGNELRIVGNGVLDFTWTATDRAITYVAWTQSSVTWSYYDQRGLLSTQPLTANPNANESDDYTCQGGELIESNSSGYRSIWKRTGGMYG